LRTGEEEVEIGVGRLTPNKSLLRTGGQWYLVCKEIVVMDKLPMISLGEPPGAELSRYATSKGPLSAL
jgi:hypothetical protein